MTAYRTLGGLTVPPYYGEYVLPTYASVVGVELVPNRPPTAPVVSWAGWHHFLLHKIKLEPEASFMHLARLVAALAIPIPLTRADFPLFPDPTAQAKEAQFKTQIYALARRSMGAGVVGGAALGGGIGLMSAGMGGGGGGGGGAASALQSMATHQMADLVTQTGVNIMNASMADGSAWFMGS